MDPLRYGDRSHANSGLMTLRGLVVVRHAGGYRFKVPERVLRQFSDHCRREGYSDGPITKEAVDGVPLRPSPAAEHPAAQRVGPAPTGRSCPSRRLAGLHAGRGNPGPCPSSGALSVHRRRGAPIVRCNRFPADVLIFEQGDGRPGVVSGAVWRRAAHLRGAEPDRLGRGHAVRDAEDPGLENGAVRTIPITRRLAATVGSYIGAAHPVPEPDAHIFYSRAPGSPINQASVYVRFRSYLADAEIPHFTGGPHRHSLRHGFPVANLRRWAEAGTDVAAMLPYLACYLGHADLRGTQYYLRLTADAYPEVIAHQIRFGYVIPAPAEDQS